MRQAAGKRFRRQTATNRTRSRDDAFRAQTQKRARFRRLGNGQTIAIVGHHNRNPSGSAPVPSQRTLTTNSITMAAAEAPHPQRLQRFYATEAMSESCLSLHRSSIHRCSICSLSWLCVSHVHTCHSAAYIGKANATIYKTQSIIGSYQVKFFRFLSCNREFRRAIVRPEKMLAHF